MRRRANDQTVSVHVPQIYRGSRPAGIKIDVLNSERVREIYKAGSGEHKGAFRIHETATL